MHLQRDRMLRKVGTQVVKWTTEGAVKEDTWNYEISSILRREGIRQLPGICWYPAKRTTSNREIKVAPRIIDYSSLTEKLFFCQGLYCFWQTKNGGYENGVFTNT